MTQDELNLEISRKLLYQLQEENKKSGDKANHFVDVELHKGKTEVCMNKELTRATTKMEATITMSFPFKITSTVNPERFGLV